MTDLSGVNNALQNGYTIKLETKGKGILHELKSVFNELQKSGKIKDANGDGLTKQELDNMYKVLTDIHSNNNMSTNYTRMKLGAEFSYSADQLLELAKAAGYDVVEEKLEAPFVAPEPQYIVEPEPELGTVPKETVAEQPEAKAEQYSADETIPKGAEFEPNQIVDEKKGVMTYTVKDENGQVHRYAAAKNDEGVYSQGEKLVPVYGSNKFLTQKSVEGLIALTFPDGLPEGVDVQILGVKGFPICIYKKDGQNLSAEDIKALTTPAEASEAEEVEEVVVTEDVVAEEPTAEVVEQPEVDTPATPAPKPEPKPEQKSARLTREQVEEFAAKDERVATLEAQLDDLKRNADELAAKPKGGLTGVSPLDVGKAQDTYRSAKRAINMYKNILAGWQDGVIDRDGFETTTLPNGQKGYKHEKVEDGHNVVYYSNISFNPEEGFAEPIPGDLVEVWVDGKKVEQAAPEEEAAKTEDVESQGVEPETYEVNGQTYISNMAGVIAAKYPGVEVWQDEFGITVKTPDGREEIVGNTPEKLQRLDKLMRGEEE